MLVQSAMLERVQEVQCLKIQSLAVSLLEALYMVISILHNINYLPLRFL